MNSLCKTYGVIINLDYAHLPSSECHKAWNKISRIMKLYGFHIDKRMFIIRTDKDKQTISELAREAINSLDTVTRFGAFSPYHYIVDFLLLDISHYNDLRFPTSDSGIELEENFIEDNISYA
ncbi:MAG TPA: hypothetical protein ENJ60_14255 [Aeromonadales bacterium]|nr:hypothetical protein [Aeromonadales bacterium]